MGTPEYSISTGHYRFGSASLTPLTLPHVSVAMRQVLGCEFEQTHAFLVDHRSHSLFCRAAFEGGLIDDKALALLALYPNRYGLYQLTQVVIKALEARTCISRKGLIPGIRKRIERLSQPMIDEPFVARLTAACIRQHLIETEDVEPLLPEGPACAAELLALCEGALQEVLKTNGERLRWHFDATIEGEELVLSATEFNQIELMIPEGERHEEIRILILKTLDAMSHFLVPFHTPASFIGPDGMYSTIYGEAYDAMKERMAGWTHEQLMDYLADTQEDEYPFESWSLGLDGERNETSLERAAALLEEMRDFDQNYNIRLNYDYVDGHLCDEMRELLGQLQQLRADASTSAPVLDVLSQALEVCIAGADSYFPIREHFYNGSAEESVVFFETLYASVAGPRFACLEDDALEHFDGYAQNSCELFVAFPLSHERLEKEVQPILHRMQQCLYLLDRLDNALKEFNHA
ncbi:hypothetical protein VPH49_20105 [Pseudomonas luteola]|uniref:hypothetical protein n=1 Tax=Pseudomonas luteola TaxID=47886 RepID=UPI003A83DC29